MSASGCSYSSLLHTHPPSRRRGLPAPAQPCIRRRQRRPTPQPSRCVPGNITHHAAAAGTGSQPISVCCGPRLRTSSQSARPAKTTAPDGQTGRPAHELAKGSSVKPSQAAAAAAGSFPPPGASVRGPCRRRRCCRGRGNHCGRGGRVQLLLVLVVVQGSVRRSRGRQHQCRVGQDCRGRARGRPRPAARGRPHAGQDSDGSGRCPAICPGVVLWLLKVLGLPARVVRWGVRWTLLQAALTSTCNCM